jgi:hypothetical protein
VLADVPTAAVILLQGEEGTGRRLVSVPVSLDSADLVENATLVEEHTPTVEHTQHRLAGFPPATEKTPGLNETSRLRAQRRQEFAQIAFNPYRFCDADRRAAIAATGPVTASTESALEGRLR